MNKHPVVVVANPSLCCESGMPSFDILAMEVKPHVPYKPLNNIESLNAKLIRLPSTGLNNYFTAL